MFARLKPFNPKRGYKVRRYSVFGIRFDHDKGWYKVDPNVAEYLKTVHCDNNDPDSPLAFDVCTEVEARDLVEAERKAALKRGEIQSPIDTASDMRIDSRSEREEAATRRSKAEQVGAIDPNEPAPTPEPTGDLTTADLPQPPPVEPTPEPTTEPTTDGLPPPPEDTTIPNVEVTPDNLTEIDGIGEATEQKFYEAGMKTYASIAESDTDKLAEIVGGKAKAIKKQAKKLAG